MFDAIDHTPEAFSGSYASAIMDAPLSVPEAELPRYYTSDLTRVYTEKTGERKLSMAEITATSMHYTFDELAAHVTSKLRYPKPDHVKAECYGWLPVLFQESDRVFKAGTPDERTQRGIWRTGPHEVDEICVLVLDVDNSDFSRPYITIDDAKAALHGLRWFGYTSHSHTGEKHKFRVVLDIDQLISRECSAKLFVMFNAKLGGQCDSAIYDPGDFLFAPPHDTTIIDQPGRPVDVLLAELGADDMIAADPMLAAHIMGKSCRAVIHATPEQLVEMKRRMETPAVSSPNVSIHNPEICRPEWIAEYKTPHWQTMRQILGQIWAKSCGELSRGDVEIIFDEIDATENFHFVLNYGELRRRQIINWLMTLPVAPRSIVQAANPCGAEINQPTGPAKRERFKILAVDDVMTMPPPIWLVPGLLTVNSLAMIYGPPASLKSFVALDVSMRMAHGMDWQGKPIKPASVVYAAGEGVSGYRKRIGAWLRHHGRYTDTQNFHLTETPELADPVDVTTFIEALRPLHPALVVLDTLARCLVGVDENSAETMTRAVAAMDRIKTELNCTVLVVHHSGKDRSRGSRGHSSLPGAMDSIIEVERQEGTLQIEIHDRKQKDNDDTGSIELYGRIIQLEPVDGEEQSSIVLTSEPLVDALTQTVANKRHAVDRRAVAGVMAIPEVASLSAIMSRLSGRSGYARGPSLIARIREAIGPEPVEVDLDGEKRTVRFLPEFEGKKSDSGWIERLL